MMYYAVPIALYKIGEIVGQDRLIGLVTEISNQKSR